MIVCTAANEAYWPGVVALNNSIRANSPGVRLHALLCGNEALAEKARAMGISYTLNPNVGAEKFPCTVNRPESTAEVHFYRILVPALFGGRAIYIDADSIVLQPLDNLFDLRFPNPVAACESNSPLDKEIEGAEGRGFISCMMLFNCDEWDRQGCFGRVVEAMNNPPARFMTGDQAALNWVLKGNWHRLPVETVAHAGHGTLYKWPKEKVLILHFLGTNPWDAPQKHLLPYPEHKEKARALWREYAA